jgi:hypothetical protein
MEHTPGPWRKANYGWAIVAGENDSYYGGHWIAEVSEPKNIPVITAAPDLLAACEAIHEWLGTGDAAQALPFEPPWYEQIRTAIAKAKGQTD